MVKKLKAEFTGIYDENISDIRVFFAPGRVNLIGEHIDYNGGYVLPCALDRGTYIVSKLRNDDKIRLYSKNFNKTGIIEKKISKNYTKDKLWSDYVLGLLQILNNHGYEIKYGFDLYCYGNIPNGAGLSSSSSLEMALFSFINSTYDFKIDKIKQIKMAKEVENNFIGVNSGIMDQFIIGVGRSENAILLNTDSLKYEYIPVKLGDYKLIIGNTNKIRGLADSKYNERYNQCQKSLLELKKFYDIKYLCDLCDEDLDTVLLKLNDSVLKKRVRHVISEQRRTVKASDCLKKGDIIDFGKLMFESHSSLQFDYEVSGNELDTLVSLSASTEGVIGARMTGAGFGGCMIALVHKDYNDSYIKKVVPEYKNIIGYEPCFYNVSIGNGAGEI